MSTVLKLLGSIFTNLLAYLSIFMMTFAPVMSYGQSISVDASAPRAYKPSITKSSTGKPTINIVAPKAGVSHNKFKSLSTNSGAIFNNSKVSGRSKTGGSVKANSNLARSGSAKVILNEVRGRASSKIKGSLEVFGAKADVIIANENGVTCDGCSFVNTGKATLSSGRPDVRGGKVTLNVQKGDVTVGRGGISGADVINLSARHVIIDGKVVAKSSVTASGGAQYFDPATGKSRAAPSDKARSAPFAVDSTRFGGIYSGTIRILSNESGLGVRALGNITANKDLVISSRGDVEVKNFKVGRNAYVGSSGNVTQSSGKGIVSGNLKVSARNFESNRAASIIAKGDVAINVSQGIEIAGEVRGRSVSVSSKKSTVNLGSVVASKALSIVAGEITNQRSVTQTTKKIYTGWIVRYVPWISSFIKRYPRHRYSTYYRYLLNNSSRTIADQQTLGRTALLQGYTVDLKATSGSVVNRAYIKANNSLNISAATDIRNEKQVERDRNSNGTYRTKYHTASISTNHVALNAGRNISNTAILKSSGNILLSARIGSIVHNADIVSSGNVSIRSYADLNNAKSITAKKNVTLVSSRGNLTNTGRITVNGSATLWAYRNINNSNAVNAGGDIRVTAYRGALTNKSYLTTKKNNTVWAYRNIDSISIRGSNTNVTSHLGSVTNRYTTYGYKTLNVKAYGDIINQGYKSRASYIFGGYGLNLDAGANVKNLGANIWSYRDINITAGTRTSGSVINSGIESRTKGSLYSGRKYATQIYTSYDNGSWRTSSIKAYGAGKLNITAQRGNIENTGSVLDADTGSLVLSASGNVSLNSKRFSNKQNVLKRQWSTYKRCRWWRCKRYWTYKDTRSSKVTRSIITDSTVNGSNITFLAGGDVKSNRTRLVANNIGVKSKNAYFDSSRGIYASTDAIFDVKSKLRVAGSSLVARNFDFRKTYAVDLKSHVSQRGTSDLKLNFYRHFTNSGTLSGRNIDLSSKWGTLKNNGTIKATNNLSLTSTRNKIWNKNGTTRTIRASDFTVIDNNGSLQAGNTLKLSAYGNIETTSLNTNNIDIKSQNGNVKLGSRIAAKGDLLLTAGNDIYNNGGTISARGSLSAFAGRDIVNQAQKKYFTLTSRHGCLGRACGKKGFTYTAASITAGDGLILNAGRDVKNLGGQISGNDFVNITAGRDVLNEGQYGKYAHKDYYRTWSKKKWYGKRTHYIDRKYDETAVLKTSTITSANGSVKLDAGRNITNIGALIQAKDDVTLDADGNIILRSVSVELAKDYYYSKRSSWFGIIKLGNVSSSAKWNQFAKIRAVVDGKKVNIKAGDNIYAQGATIVASDGARIVAGDNIIIEPNRERRYHTVENKSSGLFGWFRNDYKQVKESKTIDASRLNAKNDLTLVSAKGDIDISGSRLTAGRDINLSALSGRIKFGAEITSEYEETETYSDNGLWFKSQTKGSYTEEVIHNRLKAGGSIKFKAANGIIVEYRDTGNLADAINKFSQAEDLAWMAALQNDNRVQWNAVLAETRDWNYEAEGLTAPAAALIAIAVTAATGGAAGGIAGSITSNVVAKAAIQAGIQATINRAAISLINNKGDIGAVLKELGSDEALKSLAVSIVSAGVTAGLDSTLFEHLKNAGGEGFDPELLSQQLVRDVTYSAVRAGISTTIQGGDFGEQFVSNVRYAAASTIGKQLAEEIGSAYKNARKLPNGELRDPSAKEYFNHKLAHLALGCALGSIANGNCVAGAAGGVAGAVVAEGYEALTYDEFESKIEKLQKGEYTDAQIDALFDNWKKRGVDLSKLSGALLAAAAGGDANLGALTAENVAENNVLPFAVLLVKGALVAYTAYEVHQAVNNTISLIERFENDEITAQDLQDALVDVGIDVAIGTTIGKARILEKIYDKIDGSKLASKLGDLKTSIGRKLGRGGACSFHGSTQVLTSVGYSPIKDLTVGMSVWSRNDRTGQMGWKSVLAQYSNQYEETVHVTLRDIETGETQTIISNKIHPFFVQVPQKPKLLHLAATGTDTLVPPSSEGHRYQGPIANGHWVDASNLKAGYRLLNDDESWAEVASVEIEQKELRAYNLTVADFHTYFVRGAGNDNAEAVWVHNNCFDDLAGSLGNMKKAEFESLASGWGKGTFGNLAESLKYHANKHWNGDVAGYLRSASNFSTKGAKSTGIRADGSTKYTKNGQFAVFKDGKIVTFGKQ